MYDRNKEISEAIRAGERAIYALSEAENSLKSAGGWGVWDILGGGMLSSMIKHSKMDDAQRCIERAQYELSNFSKELRDVQMNCSVHINFDGFTKFIDIFCDNFLVDAMIQSKIRETQRNVASTKQRVNEVLYQLRCMN